MFSSDKGFVHLVFAQEDEYYIKSLACLNMRQYLYYQLKKEYEGIYFVSGTKEEFRLEIPDEQSCSIYEDTRERNLLDLFNKSFKKSVEPGIEKVIQYGQIYEFRNHLFQILNKKKKQVIVFTAESFEALFDEDDYINKLNDLKSRCQGKNILLIQAEPVYMSFRRYLTGNSGIFHSGLFSYFSCKEEDKYDKVFQRLQIHMGGCCTYLNGIRLDNIKWMIRRFLFLEEKTYDCGKAVLTDDYAVFIYAWYHSEKLRKMTGNILPENKKYLVSEIRRALMNPELFRTLEQWIEYVRRNDSSERNLLDIMKKRLYLEEEEEYIYMNSPLLKKIDHISIYDMEISDLFDRLARIKRDLKIPRIAQELLDMDENLNFCIDKLEEASERKDVQTIEKTIDALEFGVFSEEKAGLEASNIWMLFRTIINISENEWTLEKNIQKNKENVVKMTEDLKILVEKIKKMETSYPEKVTYQGEDNVSGDTILVNAKKKEAINLKNNIENIKTQSGFILTKKNQLKDELYKIEQTVNQIMLGNMTFSEKHAGILAAEKMQESLMQNIDEEEEYLEHAKNMQSVMNQAKNSVNTKLSPDEILTRYEDMIHSNY